MLAAVNSQKRGYEALGLGHFLGGGAGVKQPRAGVPSALPESARIPSTPGQTPSFNGILPASSQQPANRKPNQRIPYARFMFTFQEDVAAPRDLQTGDLVFVHKTSQAMGSGTQRMTKSTGLPQLNAILSNHRPGYTTLSTAGPTGTEVGRRILQARAQLAKADRLLAQQRDDEGRDAEVARLKREVERLEDPTTPTPNVVDPFTDWPAVVVLSEWTPDGVLYGMDDDALRLESPHDARDDGVLLNVAIQGPTPMRNTAWQIEKTNSPWDWAAQFIDSTPIVMDSVFVGLVSQKLPGDQGWAFNYKIFTGRQALAFAEGLDFSKGPSSTEFKNMVTAWKIGKIMDTNAVSNAEDRRIVVNVSISEWPMRLTKRLNRLIRLKDDDKEERRDVNWLGWEFRWQLGSGVNSV